jgi:hypothetical protein
MDIVVIASLVILIGFIAFGISFFVMRKNRINQKNAPIECVFVTVGGTYSESKTVNKNFTSSTVDSYNGYQQKSYYIHFRTKKNQKLSFRVSKKIWLTFHDGDQGMLTYQGYKILNFEHKKGIELNDSYFDRTHQSEKPFYIYGQAQNLGVNIDSKLPFPCHLRDLKRFISALKEDSSDWFFTLKKDEDTIFQYEKENENDILETDFKNDQTQIIPMDMLFQTIKKRMVG